MKLRDIAGQGIRNLLRHRGRTLLTVLGVIVGCCSVVIMISIGIGMRISTQAALEQMGDLNVIDVSAADSSDGRKLDATAVEAIRSIEHAQTVIPKIRYYGDISILAGSQDRYKAEYVSLLGEDPEHLKMEGYELTVGDWSAIKKGEALAGEYLAYNFRDTKRPDGYNWIERYDYYDWETDTFSDLPDPYVNLAKDNMTLIIGSTESDTGERSVRSNLKIAGVVKARGYEVSDSLIMDLATLEKLLDEYARLTGGKKQSETGYTSIKVIVDNISNVESVETQIRKLGFFTSSMESIRKPMEQEMQQKQMLLGCVGAVSLFVAALGIANTMIMAITERIREIGVMKALGCYLRDIRKMFLLEAGFIGLTGGIVGIGLSYAISAVMNSAGTGSLFGSDYEYLIDPSVMSMSVIPWWLAAFAVLFSIVVGVVAGLYPAEKAVRIPALDAIRHE